MTRKSILIALAATATLGAAMLTSTASNAYVIHGGFHGGFHGGYHGGYHGPVFRRPVVWHRPFVYAAPVAYAVARPVAAAPTCNCLSKEYTPEGAVLFKDNCTNEAAMNPPVAPQQSGMIEQPQGQPQTR